MENHEFDQALRDFVQSSKLPYDPLQWDRMAERLEAHGDAPKPIIRQQMIPFFPWTVSTAAACLLITTIWLLSRTISGIPAAQQQAVAQQSVPVSPRYIDAEEEPEKAPEMPNANGISVQPVHSIKNIKKSTLPAQALLAAAVDIQPEVQVITTDSESSIKTAEKTNHVTKVNPFISLPSLPEEDYRQPGRKTAFGVHGGYNIGQAKNNFTLGLSVKQKLNERLNIETGIAVVSGAYETTHESPSANSGFSPSSASARTSEPTSTNLTYLQAAPSLNYRIYRGLSAGGGADVQRLLSKNLKTVTVNSFGLSEETDTQPDWDFGLTARMDVQVAKKLRAGMMYRESVHRISKGAQDAAGRNYLLLQLSYTIY